MRQSVLEPGDHLKVDRGWYEHHGIYVGEGSVVHFTGEPKQPATGEVCETPLGLFSAGDTVEVVQYGLDECLPAGEVVARARSQLGETEYSVVFNNCERLAIWCKTGDDEFGPQVTGRMGGALTGGAAGAATGARLRGVPGAIVGGLGGFVLGAIRRPRGRPTASTQELAGLRERLGHALAAERRAGATGGNMIVSDGFGGAWVLDRDGEVWHVCDTEEVKVAEGYGRRAQIASDLEVGLWVLDSDGELWHLGDRERLISKDHVSGAQLTVSRAGEAWVLDGDGELWAYTLTTEQKISSGYLPGAGITPDGRGGVWILDEDGELWHATPGGDELRAKDF
jgi:hypothetical protein